MTWFYYSGNIARAIPVKKGLSVSVWPHSKVEVFDVGQREVQALMKKGILRRTGKPRDAGPSRADTKVVTIEEIKAATPKSAMALRIAEKGVTSDKGQAPKRPQGLAPEMTEGELNVIANVDTVKPVEKPAEKPVDKSESDKDVESGVPVGADLAEVLSNVASSPVENTEGDKKKRRNRRNK